MEEKNTNVSAPPKRKRHFILVVLVIAAVLLLGGELVGSLIMLPFEKLSAGADSSIQFLFMYLAFIGIDILVLLYCAAFEKEVFRSFLSAGRGGGRDSRADRDGSAGFCSCPVRAEKGLRDLILILA